MTYDYVLFIQTLGKVGMYHKYRERNRKYQQYIYYLPCYRIPAVWQGRARAESA